MTIKRSWQKRFLDSLAKTGNVTVSVIAAGVSRQYAYLHRHESEKFAAEWEEAITQSIDLLEAEARRRAHEGVTKKIYYQGDEIGEVQEYSDSLMMFLLRAHRPQKYRDNQRIEHTGAGGKPIEHRITDLSNLSADELIRLHQETLTAEGEDR